VDSRAAATGWLDHSGGRGPERRGSLRPLDIARYSVPAKQCPPNSARQTVRRWRGRHGPGGLSSAYRLPYPVSHDGTGTSPREQHHDGRSGVAGRRTPFRRARRAIALLVQVLRPRAQSGANPHRKTARTNCGKGSTTARPPRVSSPSAAANRWDGVPLSRGTATRGSSVPRS
jgi:hypothetical protein